MVAPLIKIGESGREARWGKDGKLSLGSCRVKVSAGDMSVHVQ